MLIWVTDCHLDFFPSPIAAEAFALGLKEDYPNATGLLLTGDISEGLLIKDHLTQIAKAWEKPVYFVLGNHDYYDCSFAKIDKQIKQLTKEIKNLNWLNEGAIKLNQDTALVGVGGWYDAMYGNSYSKVVLHDWKVIEDLYHQSRYRELLIEKLQKRAGQEADILNDQLKSICKESYKDIIVATHIPPFDGASWHKGSMSDREWLPWFTSRSTGVVLEKFAENNPDKKFVVFCGHCHSSGIYKHFDNLVVYTGFAKYGSALTAGIIKYDERKVIMNVDARQTMEQGY